MSVSDRQPSSPRLSLRLLTPSAVLSVVLLGLTTLPMASCSSSQGSDEIVPIRVAIALSGSDQSNPPPLSERVVLSITSLPLLFLITSPYWTAVPIVAAIVLVGFSTRWATRCWRTLVLSLAVCWVAMLIAGEPPWAQSIAACCLVAVGLWIRSSPSAHRLWQTTLRVVGRSPRDRAGRRVNPVAGGFWAFGMLCLVAMTVLAAHEELLIGGRLAATTNAAMGIVAIVSARQAAVDCDRFPRFGIRDLMIAVLVFAITLAWFWN